MGELAIEAKKAQKGQVSDKTSEWPDCSVNGMKFSSTQNWQLIRPMTPTPEHGQA